MAYLSFQQIAVADSVKTVADLTVPAKATGAELQPDTGNIRYTMDDSNPSTTEGMLLLAARDPVTFLVSDLRAIKVIRDGGVSAKLNIHYFAGRDV